MVFLEGSHQYLLNGVSDLQSRFINHGKAVETKVYSEPDSEKCE